MKICPTCKQTYTDETLNFCLNDGAILNPLNKDDSGQATVFLPQQQPTNPNQPVKNTTFPNQSFPQYPGQTQNVLPPPVKKSKTWIWVLGIVGVLLVLGGIGFIGIVALVATNLDDTDNTSNVNKISVNKVEKSPTPVAFKNVQKDDFSGWRSTNDTYAVSEYRNGEFYITTKIPKYLYVYNTTNTMFKTTDASTKVTVRNVNGVETDLGYGLIVHADPKTPLTRGFCFLIDSSKQSYRVAQHKNKIETTLVDWAKSPSIRSGTQTNELEVKDQSGKMSFFINGQFVTTVNNPGDDGNGIVGIYASGVTPIAYTNLQIGK